MVQKFFLSLLHPSTSFHVMQREGEEEGMIIAHKLGYSSLLSSPLPSPPFPPPPIIFECTNRLASFLPLRKYQWWHSSLLPFSPPSNSRERIFCLKCKKYIFRWGIGRSVHFFFPRQWSFGSVDGGNGHWHLSPQTLRDSCCFSARGPL